MKKGMKMDEFRRIARENIDDYDEILAEVKQERHLQDTFRELRKSQKLTQKELAKKLNLTQANISKIENDVSHMRLDTIVRYLAALGKTIKITIEDSSVAQTQHSEEAVG